VLRPDVEGGDIPGSILEIPVYLDNQPGATLSSYRILSGLDSIRYGEFTLTSVNVAVNRAGRFASEEHVKCSAAFVILAWRGEQVPTFSKDRYPASSSGCLRFNSRQNRPYHHSLRGFSGTVTLVRYIRCFAAVGNSRFVQDIVPQCRGYASRQPVPSDKNACSFRQLSQFGGNFSGEIITAKVQCLKDVHLPQF